MVIELMDNKGNKVTVSTMQVGIMLEMIYQGVYEGSDRVEEFIDWIQSDCPGMEED